MGLVAALAMSLSLLAFTPGTASAASGYGLDGSSPASCPSPYVSWASSTITPSGVTGYIKTELVYCPAWQTAWTRAYNYTSRSSVLLATGIDRTSSDGHNNNYDYVRGSCDSFCLDWVAYGHWSYGRELYVPNNFNSLGTLKASVYYCINSNCSSHANPLNTYGPPIVPVKIQSLTNAYRGHDCSGFSFNGISACSTGWCGVFAAWAWQTSGVNVGGLAPNPASFAAYGTDSQPHVGDAVVFSQDSLGGRLSSAHVAIVVAVSNGIVTSVGGNEDNLVKARSFSSPVGSQAGLLGTGMLYVQQYVLPRY
jgi:hypothetical protein